MIQHASTAFGGAPVLGKVIGVKDPEGIARVQVTYPLNAEADDIKTEAWAAVATPFAGKEHGAYMLPGVDDVVVLTFLNNDPRSPVVLGSVWTGQAKPPEEGKVEQTDRWVMKGRKGTKIAMVEEASGAPMIEIVTPGGNSITMADDGTKITISASKGTSKIEMDSSGITLTSAKVSIKAPEVEINSGKVAVQAALSDFSGVLKGSVGQMTTVVASTYTPGAGNML
ncbi:MAG: phage baseplate assembly protein V [Sulfitobacter sp.]